MKIFRNIALAVVVLLTVVIVGLCFMYKHMISPVSSDKTLIELEIPANSSSTVIAKILKEDELIRNEKFFLLYVKLFKISDMKAGYYSLSKSMGTEEIVEILRKGSTKNPNEIQITFQEGLNMRQIADIISRNTSNTSDDVIEKSAFLYTSLNRTCLLYPPNTSSPPSPVSTTVTSFLANFETRWLG